MCTERAVATAQLERVTVVSNEPVGPELREIVLVAPQTAASIKGGQFVHLSIAKDSLTLRRPLSVYRTEGDRIHIVYHVKGRGTRLLAEKLPGDASMDLIGPIGRPWPIPEGCERALLIGGGVGAAPLGMLAQVLADRGVTVVTLLGAQSAERLVGEDHFVSCGANVTCSTDDGSYGVAGRITEPLRELLESDRFDVAYVCGPEIMQSKVSAHTVFHGIKTYVSLERLMACGVGACLSCVVPTTSGQKRACVDGPVFDAEEVLWDEAAQSRV